MSSHHDEEEGLLGKVKEKNSRARKKAALIGVGIITFLYCIAELGVAVYTDSLSLLSDGFHNLSDVVSLCIAFYALHVSTRGQSDSMSYGWKRMEVVGALTNGIFLISLCLYIVLEAIPRFISPPALEDHSLFFIITSASGIGINLIGTIAFAITGTEAHVGHSHDHGHGHDDHGHGHSHGKKDKKQKKKHAQDHEKKPDAHSVNEDIIHPDHDDHDHGHGHDDHDHDHGHGHDDHDHGHDHDHGKKKEKKKKKHKHDMNIWAVFLHYLGDVISSVLVLASGLLMHFFPDSTWVRYTDPVASILVVIIVLATTVGLVRQCVRILLQSVPTEVDLKEVRARILKLHGVYNVHELHVWQLVDGMSIGTAHIDCDSQADFQDITEQVKSIFHGCGIHSSTIQPEFHKQPPKSPGCEASCAADCEEMKCCPAEAPQQSTSHKRTNYSATEGQHQ